MADDEQPASNPPRDGGSPVVLAVEDLHVRYAPSGRLFRRPGPPVEAVNGATFEITAGSTFGLVGESGSGKSSLARAVLGLTEPAAGRVLVNGRDTTSPAKGLAFRRQVQAVLQDPYSSLNPAHPVSVIVGDAVTVHHRTPRGPERDQAVTRLLHQVGLGADLLGRHPRELSGGQRQRVSIARALAAEPSLLIADEPTSALDVSVQGQVLNLLAQAQAEHGLALLLIGHDLDLIAHAADITGVLYAGHLVEQGPAASVHDSPAHPYTEALTAAAPVPDPAAQAERRARRRALAPPTAADPPSGHREGCPFAARCPAAFEPCHTSMPEPSPAHHGGTVCCWLHTTGPTLAGRPVGPHLQATTQPPAPPRPVLTIGARP